MPKKRRLVCIAHTQQGREGGDDLDTILGAIQKFFEQYIWHPFTQFTWNDALDIVILAGLLYCIYLFFRGRRAGKFAIGIAIIFILYGVSAVLELRAVHRILAAVAPFSVVLLAIIFQPELRAALEKLGDSPFGFFSVSNPERTNLANTVNEVVDAACRIALTEKDGALIVIERTTKLGDYLDKGTRLNAQVTSNLLCNIFVDRSPLHDGAVIISNNCITVAGSKLPLSVNEDVVRGMGTRHRAAVGITEVSDCVVIVVSEERHIISIANNGEIKRDYYSSPLDLRNESSMKNIQNLLRNDLFLLLAGKSFDELSEGERTGRGKRPAKPRRTRRFPGQPDDEAFDDGFDSDNGLDEVFELGDESEGYEADAPAESADEVDVSPSENADEAPAT